MRHFAKTIVLALALAGTSLQAQEPEVFTAHQRPVGNSGSAHQPGPTMTWTTHRKEMAREYIRVRAQAKAEARSARLEAMRSLGYSPERPTVSAIPFMSRTPNWTVYDMWYPMGYPIWYHSWTPSTYMYP